MKQNLRLLADIGNGNRLACSQAQDQYFVVRPNGQASKIDLQKAVQLYLRVQAKVDSGEADQEALLFGQTTEKEEEKISFADRLRKRLDLPSSDKSADSA